MTSTDRYAEFRRLHLAGCFVIPNAWDIGSARMLERLGFPAIASTSAGFAWSVGRQDNHVSLGSTLAHLRDLAGAVAVPINADFGNGFAVEPADVAANVARAAESGVCGVSIEDATGHEPNGLYDLALATERIRAARRALDTGGRDVMLIGRSEGFLLGRPDMGDTLRRLVAYSEAGADCLYAPGIRSREQIAEVVRAVAPKPVNVLVGSGFATVAELAALGVRRISVGGALARAAWGGFLAAAREIAEHGTFGTLTPATPFAELEEAMRDPETRGARE
jgi:methylisocitrate lyase